MNRDHLTIIGRRVLSIPVGKRTLPSIFKSCRPDASYGSAKPPLHGEGSHTAELGAPFPRRAQERGNISTFSTLQ